MQIPQILLDVNLKYHLEYQKIMKQVRICFYLLRNTELLFKGTTYYKKLTSGARTLRKGMRNFEKRLGKMSKHDINR